MARERTTAQAGAAQGATPDAMAAQGRSPRQGQPVQDESMVDQARDTAQELASQAREKASQQLESGVTAGKNRAASTLGSVARSLLVSSQQLRAQDEQGVGRYVERAANRVEQLADYMQNTSPGEMADGVERFARREPALFLGGVFALGFLGARFLKSSRRDQERQRWEQGQGAAAYPYQGTSAQRGSAYAGYGGRAGYGGTAPRYGTDLADREVPTPSPSRPADLGTSRTASQPGTDASTARREPGAGGPAGSPTWGSGGSDRY